MTEAHKCVNCESELWSDELAIGTGYCDECFHACFAAEIERLQRENKTGMDRIATLAGQLEDARDRARGMRSETFTRCVALSVN